MKINNYKKRSCMDAAREDMRGFMDSPVVEKLDWLVDQMEAATIKVARFMIGTPIFIFAGILFGYFWSKHFLIRLYHKL